MYYLVTKVKFIQSPVSNGWMFWYVSHTSMVRNSEVNIFKAIKLVGIISNKLPNYLFGTNVYKIFKSCW